MYRTFTHMKKFLTILLLTVVIISCKKEKKEPAQEPPPAPPVKEIVLKIDGVESSCTSCASSFVGLGTPVMNFNFPDSDDLIVVNFYLKPGPGTYPLKRNDYTYKDQITLWVEKGGQAYTAVTGTINITKSDTTSKGAIKRLVAGFSFITDTINGKFLTVTDGAIDFTDM